jgi:16S rRNA C967 or C1407 C5-methylase (RsmB/RsmF family)
LGEVSRQIFQEDKNMTREELFKKNQQLSTEFELYLLEHPEIEEKIPDNAMIVLMPDYDKELAEKNVELAEANKEPGQTIVYVRVEKLRISRIEGLTLQMS